MSKRTYASWLAIVVAVSALLSYRANSLWDYPEDAGPAIDALIHGRIHEFLQARPLMGPVSLILRAPFAALSLLTEGPRYDFFNDAYRFGIFPCLVLAGLLGIHLAQVARRNGMPQLIAFALGGLCLVSTVNLKALEAGHPEEIVGAVLCVVAMLAGLKGRAGLAIVALVLALGTKQWAVVAIVPVALMLSRPALVKGAKIAVALGAVMLIPFVVAGPASLWHMTRHLADVRDASLLPADIWWLFRTDAGLPDWVGLIAHPLLIAVCVATALALAPRVRQDPVGRGLPLLALVLLLRCVLDPLDNAYYHVPFFVTLLAADAVSGRFLASLVATVALFVTTKYATSLDVIAAIYLTWSLPFVVYLAGRAYGLDWAAIVRSRVARGPGVAPQMRSS